MNTNTLLCTILAVLPITTRAAASTQLPPDTLRRIEAEVQSFRTAQRIPGLSVAVGDTSGVAWAKGYGVADQENAVPVQPDTVFRFASVSKAMTAAAAMRLAAAGRLDLDAPVQRYCPAYPNKPWRLTARHLLAHLGGVRHYRGDGSDYENTRFWPTIADSLAIFKADPLLFQPGARFEYTTFGYNLLGCALEGAAGKSFAAVLEGEVWRPAGLTGTRVDEQATIIPLRASGYVRLASSALTNSQLADTSYKIPGGGLAGTASDLVRFGSALLSNRLLSSQGFDAMATEQRTSSGERTGYGLGLIVEQRSGLREVFHTGAQHRVSTIVYMLPDHDVVVAVLANLEDQRVATLARAIADILIGGESAPTESAPTAWYDRIKS